MLTREKLAMFFQTNSDLPVEETLELLRQQTVDVFKNSADQGIKGITFLFESYKQAIESQSVEMSLLKVMETYIRRGTMTNEKLEEILVKLDQARAIAMEKFNAMTAAASVLREKGGQKNA